jgi:uncharacterized integral membrane protein
MTVVLVILAVLIAIVALVFAIQNAAPVTVTFLFWQLEASLALVLVLTFVLGLIVAFLATVPGLMRRSREIAGYKKKLGELQKMIAPPPSKNVRDDKE